MAQLLEDRIRQQALNLGFDSCHICEATLDTDHANNLREYVAANAHGTMTWMEETLERRSSPKAMWADARSAIVVTMNYAQQKEPKPIEAEKANISIYARNRDYHDIMKGKLKQLAGKLTSWKSKEVKVFVDTAPLMEKPLAQRAGVGWQGKHTNLVSRELGSWFFLGVILTASELKFDEPEIDHCGNCTACLQSCPTDAFSAPYKIDARKCISYLTIEHDGVIPFEFRKAMGNRIYGCDDCLAACPWNKFAKQGSEMNLREREDLRTPDLAFLASLDDAQFRKFFSGSPIKRIGRNRFIRNVLIAIGNSRSARLVPVASGHLVDPEPFVRAHAVWALAQLLKKEAFLELRDIHRPAEEQKIVLREWDKAPGHE